MVAVTLALQLLLMTMVGIFARKAKIVNETFAPQLTKFVMQITIPALIFHSVKNSVEFSMDTLKTCGVAVAAGFLVMAVSLAIGQALYRVKGGGYGRILRYSAAFTHFSFMGIPVINALYGDEGNLYYAFFIVPVRIFYYTLSEPLMTPAGSGAGAGGRGTAEKVRKAVTNPALLAVLFGLVFWVGGIPVPGVIDYVIRQCSSLASPLGLILCGLTLGSYDIRGLAKPENLKIPAFRLILLPAFWTAVGVALVRFAGLDPLVGRIMIVFSALPVASLLPVYTVQYDPDPDNQFMAAGVSVLSTLLSTVTLPVWYLLLSSGVL